MSALDKYVNYNHVDLIPRQANIQALTLATINAAALVTTIVLAAKGKHGAATVAATLWVGLTNNSHHTVSNWHIVKPEPAPVGTKDFAPRRPIPNYGDTSNF